ncbi:Major facilitator superfamily protein [Euphorbia peplus]|nr:Major facilitator superfamily protein [Euphorbia peplus]
MDPRRDSADLLEKSFMEPSMEKFVDSDHYQTKQQEIFESSKLVSNGCVDFRGRIADKEATGGWKASPFIIANEVAERLAFFAVAVNMVSYLVIEMKISLPDAATYVTDWIGAAYVLTLFGAFLADAYLGRFKTIIVFSCVYSVGMVLLTLSASTDSLRPPQCLAKPCTKATPSQNGFLFGALALIAIGTGGIKPCVSSFGADQFDEADDKEKSKKSAFFNWFFFAINMGAILGITVMVYITEEKGFGWGFAIPTGTTILSIFILSAGIRYYRYQKPMGSPFTRFVQVIVASVRNHFRGVHLGSQVELYEVSTPESAIKGAKKLPHTTQFKFLDKAAVLVDPEESSTANRWNLCTVTQVEELKSLIRILPIWATTIALSISFAQLATFFTSQARLMDRDLGPHFTIPSGSVSVFSAVNALLLVPVYEKLIVPVLRKHTGHPRGLTSLQRMGVGLFISIFSLISAALIEKKRRDSALSAPKMSVFWLFPQFFLIGAAEVFTYVGQLEFFYDEATDGTRSISSALFLCEVGIGSWLSTGIVKAIERFTGGQEEGWIRSDLNESRIDNFYWILSGINAVNFLVYVFVAWRFKGRNCGNGSVVDESRLVEMNVNERPKVEDQVEYQRVTF